MKKPAIIIYCDGGLGNRLNALLSGLAISRHFGLARTIHWPVNSNCGAAIEDLIETSDTCHKDSLSSLHNKVNGFRMLLHDKIASERLGSDFSSAYSYDSLADFEVKVIATGKPIFYYPALIPGWIPPELIAQEVKFLRFNKLIELEAAKFITETLSRPYHGLHLRRTDLNIGFSDLEVHRIVSAHRDQLFFVCSDDPLAERIAAAHPNVEARQKISYVTKNDVNSDWLNPRIDEDGRVMGNLERGRESVINAAIDLLILGNSRILGHSGSTFQSIARLMGDHYGLVDLNRPPALHLFSPNEISRNVKAKKITATQLLQIAETWASELREPTALRIIQSALDYFDGNDRLQFLYGLAQLAIKDNQLFMSSLYLRELIRLAPTLADPRNLLTAVERQMAGVAENINPRRISLGDDELQVSQISQLIEKSNPLILEIGANCGQTTVEFLREFPGAEIHAFEPDPRAVQKFRAMITSPNVNLVEKAVGARNGTVEFNQSGGHEWIDPNGWDHSGSIRKPKNHLKIWPSITFNKTIAVDLIRLDDWSREVIGPREIDFIWADVQGAEIDLIQGGALTLARTRFFYTEFSDEECYEGQIDFNQLVQLMNDLGHRVRHKFRGDVLFERIPR
jgi:FkbM family methyltransferase